MKICDYCGRENADEAAHCWECGTRFETAQEDSPPPSTKLPRDPLRVSAEKKMLSGAITFIAGILVTGLTYLNAVHSPFGGTYVIAWGAMLVGGVRFFRGLTERDQKPRSGEDAGYGALAQATRLEAQGRIQEALALYQQISEKFPESDAGQDAKKSIESIHARRA